MDEKTGTRHRKPESKNPETGLTPTEERFCYLIAEDKLTNARICEEIGISVGTMYQWKEKPEFKTEIAKQNAILDDEIAKLPGVRRRDRVRILAEMVGDYLTIRDERAEHYVRDHPEVPGGKTGRIIKTLKQVGVGKSAELIEEHGLDKSLDDSLRATIAMIAKERGEDVQKREITGPGGGPIVISEVVISHAGDDTGDDEDDD